MSRVLVISFTDLGSDPRLDRQIAMLREEHAVDAAGLGPPRADVEFIDLGGPPRSAAGRGAGLARLLARRPLAVYWTHPDNRRALGLLEDVACDAVVANDVPALPLAVRLGRPVVFDAHEYAPAEQAESLAWRAVIAPYVRALCRAYLPHVRAMMTVAPSIAEAYEREFGVRAAVVTNAPAHAALSPSPVAQPIRLLHHGIAQRARRLEVMLDVFALLDGRFSLDLVLAEGTPGYREELAARAAALPGAQVVEPRPMHELVAAANAYDIGLYLLPPQSLNQEWALPNKFFEFVQARLAVAIGPSPEMARIAREHGFGIVAGDFEPATLAAALNALSVEDVAALKARADAAAAELSLERNREIVLDLVASVL